MSKKSGICVLIISIVAIVLSVVTLVVTITPSKQHDGDVQYVLFVGTNDIDTNEPQFSPEEAKDKAEEILLRYFDGYTIQDANGGWVGEGKIYKEYTLVIYLSNTDSDKVHTACDDLIKEFNQSSILIQTNLTGTEFYEGR